MRRAVLIALLAALMVVTVVAGAALAGEKSGPPGPDGAEGEWTPASDRANSIWSFSGLNDEITTEGPFPEPTQTQSYGTFLVLMKKSMGIGAQEAKQLLPSPGVACNPTSGFEE